MAKKSTQAFTDLIVWQRAHQFVLSTYKMTEGFPQSEIYGLTSQFRRAAISIAANIAESYKKWSNKEKVRFLNISQGSLEECRYYLILSKDLGYCEVNEETRLIEEVSKLLYGYINSIKKSDS
ncbi:MAG: four helix bundle protein [Ignavibacterium sp.]|nr:MAG: four helix bundle protein [Ignavibacterium sp.]